jgi:hypothetical protein
MRVSYREDPAVSFTANLIRAWARGEIEGPVMSTSSGPKDYVRNHIWAIFDRFPDVASVLMVRGEYTHSRPFLLVTNEAGQIFDMAGKEVEAKEV